MKILIAKSSNEVLQPDLLEMLFEYRNKAYGAYYLRRAYGDTLRRAVLITVTAVGVLCSFSFLRAEPTKNTVTNVVVELDNIDELEVKKEPVTPPKIKVVTPVAPMKQFVALKLKPDDQVKTETPPPTDDELKNTQIGPKDVKGDPNANPNIIDPGDGEDMTKIPNIVVKPNVIDEPVDFVEQMPEFPGGSKALMEYISRNIQYPEIARENGYEGTVALSFVVNQDGNITDVTILRDVPGGCGAEAVRVIKSMPAWKPGRQNGNVVKVRYKLPVKFRLG